tara:strand:- start:436 stop:900 length:465 start_codon:yes stop_codon:yes gene_type:complete
MNIQFGTLDGNVINNLILRDIQSLDDFKKLKNKANSKGNIFSNSNYDTITLDFGKDLESQEIDKIIKKIDDLTLKKKTIFIIKNKKKQLYRHALQDISFKFSYIPLILFTLFMLYQFYIEPDIGIDDYVRSFIKNKYLLVFLFIIFFGLFQSIV